LEMCRASKAVKKQNEDPKQAVIFMFMIRA
jgi:hypothetical protein